jgi:hypothetical protein
VKSWAPTECVGCGSPITQQIGSGQPRKWCGDTCRKRHWERSAKGRGVCVDCGSLKGAGGYRSERCRDCYAAFELRVRQERAVDIEQMWKAGWLMPEIAAALGWSISHLGVEIFRLRRDGLADLPYRQARPARQAAA